MSDATFRWFSGIHEGSEKDGAAVSNHTKIILNSQFATFQTRKDKLQTDIVGSYCKFQTPFGDKPVCYVDWTASGKAVASIEKYILSNVLLLYGNTHTTTSITGK